MVLRNGKLLQLDPPFCAEFQQLFPRFFRQRDPINPLVEHRPFSPKVSRQRDAQLLVFRPLRRKSVVFGDFHAVLLVLIGKTAQLFARNGTEKQGQRGIASLAATDRRQGIQAERTDRPLSPADRDKLIRKNTARP